jgi:predicted Co/Zn/Cd cation transporter (cation efflux family)
MQMDQIESVAGRTVLLEKLTILWAGIAAGVALLSGILAGSFARFAFGADSGVEVMSAVLVLVRQRALARGEQPDAGKEHRFPRILAVLFFVSAVYVVASASFGLVNGNHPSKSVLGHTITMAAAMAMPSLAFAKRRVSLVLTAAGSTSSRRLLKTDDAPRFP